MQLNKKKTLVEIYEFETSCLSLRRYVIMIKVLTQIHYHKFTETVQTTLMPSYAVYY